MVHKLTEIIKASNNIVFFTGAGVSTESGIPDFRSSDGIFYNQTNYRPEEVVSKSFFLRQPKDFYGFYKNKMVYPQAKPNACHLGIAKLEELGKVKAVITQNIDHLHQLAGSKEVYELHGSIMRNHCMSCNTTYGLEKIIKNNNLPICDQCGGLVKPDVVLYEENLDDTILSKAIEKIRSADTLIVCGTSLIVYPAAGLVRYFRGNNFVIINKSKTHYDGEADFVINDDVGKVMSAVMDNLKINSNL